MKSTEPMLEEGRLVQHVYKEGKYEDLIHYGVINTGI